MQKPRLLLLLAFLLLVSAGVASLAWASQRAADELAEGVVIGGVDVGGLDADQALARVWHRLRGPAMRGVRIRVAGRTFVLTAREADLRLRLPAAVNRGLAASREGTFIERGWRELTGGDVSSVIRVRPTVSQDAVREFVAAIERRVARPAVDARLSIEVDRVTVTPERTGRRLAGARALTARIVRSVLEPKATRRFEGRLERVKPAVTRAELWRSTPAVITVSRSDRQARLFRRGRLVASYRVAVGQPGYPTPLGQFAVQTMQKDPVWNVPDSEWAGELAGQTIPAGDPRNPLIARWIGFDGAVGFHGTESLDSLGRAASRGCVRMRAQDIIELFDRVQIGTPVLVAR
jgi:hypothetical protein